MGIGITWKGDLSFEGTDGRLTLPLDTSVEQGGSDQGFRPMQLLLIGLAGCTGMDVISILKKKRQEVTDFEIHVQGERATEHPKVFTNIELEFVVTGHHIDPEAVERAVELSSTKYCSAEAMLGKVAHITHKITLLEAATE